MPADAAGERMRFLVGLMKEALLDYEAGRSDLAQLVRGVESAIDSLEAVADAAWVRELRRHWGTLEIIYAVMLDEGRAALTDEERRNVAEAIATLRLLVER
jgi:hypothetical protein